MLNILKYANLHKNKADCQKQPAKFQISYRKQHGSFHLI